jgi:hypothetical protein
LQFKHILQLLKPSTMTDVAPKKSFILSTWRVFME